MSTQDVTELCKPVDGYPNYRVWRFGIVERFRKDKYVACKQFPNSGGYFAVSISQNGKTKNFRVHKLVLEAFVSKRPAGLQCCHCDGNKENNRVENLRWDTPQENIKDKVKHGTQARGEKNYFAKLTERKVLEIYEFSKTLSDKELSRRYGIAEQTVHRIRTKKIWVYLTKDLPLPRERKNPPYWRNLTASAE